jgi:hypothetical protein
MSYTLQEQYSSKNQVPGSQADSVWHRGARKVSSITIHWWGNKGQKFATVRDFLCTNNSPTSAHYVVQDGLVACIVSPDDCAFHAGNAEGNSHSIGIECRPEATDGDYATIAELIRDLRAIYGDIPLRPHNYWYNTACPGDYDLARLDSLARGTSTITTQSATITPIQEEDIMASIGDLKNTLLDPEVLEAIGKAVHTRPVPYFDPETGQDTGTGTNLAVLAGASDFQHSATRRVLASAAGAIVDAVKAAQPQDAANVAQAAYDEFMKKLDATTLKVGVK